MEGQDMDQPAEDVNAGDTPGDIVEDVQESVTNDTVAGTNVSQNDISMGDAAGCPTELCNYCVKPVQVCGAWSELSKSITKGCKWSTDGSCILTSSDDNFLRLFNLPNCLFQLPVDWNELQEMSSVLQCKESGLIYDYAWYPGMTSADPATCCFASTSAGNPIHLWDAYTGQLRCSYRPYNHLDEPVAAHSISFDASGEKLYCGFNKMIRVFDVASPGRSFDERPTNVKKMGQPGIISCFAFGAQGIYAAGSYCKTVAMYSESDGQLQFMLSGHLGGVTHLRFSPDGTRLYSGGRKVKNEVETPPTSFHFSGANAGGEATSSPVLALLKADDHTRDSARQKILFTLGEEETGNGGQGGKGARRKRKLVVGL